MKSIYFRIFFTPEQAAAHLNDSTEELQKDKESTGFDYALGPVKNEIAFGVNMLYCTKVRGLHPRYINFEIVGLQETVFTDDPKAALLEL
jgi:hypothetical protein